MLAIVAHKTAEQHEVRGINLHRSGVEHSLQVEKRLDQLHNLGHLAWRERVAKQPHMMRQLYYFFFQPPRTKEGLKWSSPAPGQSNRDSLGHVEEGAVHRVPLLALVVGTRNQVVDGHRVQQERKRVSRWVLQQNSRKIFWFWKKKKNKKQEKNKK